VGFKDQVSGGGLDSSSGFMIKNPAAPHRTQLPSWENETQLRVFPSPKAEGGWHTMRESDNDDNFGPAVWAEPVARRLGVFEQFTYVTRIPGSQTEDPTTKFCRAIIKTAKDHPHDIPSEWYEWTQKKGNAAPKIAHVNRGIFFQAAMFMIDGKLCTDRTTGQPAPQFPLLFMGTVSLLMSFQHLGNTLTPGYTGPKPDSVMLDDPQYQEKMDAIWAAMFKLGDWSSPLGGRLLRVFKAPSDGNFDKPHYAIDVAQNVPITGLEDKIRQFWMPWEQLLRFHSAEEQIGYLLRAFPAEAVDFALGRSEYETLLPAQVRGSWMRSKGQGVAQGFTSQAATQQMVQPQTGAPTPSFGQQPPQQPQQPAPQTQQPAPQTQQAPSASSPWGTGEAAPVDELPDTGVNVPGTPAEFAQPPQTQQTQTTAASYPGQVTAPNTPAGAVAGGAVDPAGLAGALDKMNAGRRAAGEGNPGQAQ